ncbi:MAG TPA: rhomboid family intramembrane serine protease [Bradyrhizobium sp.]|nr:rhomboid family intramembrane serine protease [Bradyrhizobium sp.]
MSDTIITAPPAVASSKLDPPDKFCRYLARQFCARQGFTVGTVPEAAGLIGASDIVLTSNGGLPLTILCLIDREANPDRTFDLPGAELERIAAACAKYASSITAFGPNQLSVAIRVIEVGPTSTERWEQLKGLTSAPTAKCHVTALAVDTAKQEVLWNTRLDRPERTFIEEMLQAPRTAVEDMRPAAALPAKTIPYATLGLVATLVAIFVAELSFGIEAPTKPLEPSIKTLIALGGLQYVLTIDQGQWWRVFTGPLLHLNVLHLAFNSFALLMAGEILERAVGRLWFAAIFAIGALGGACGSLLVNAHLLVSVGASGAIMALFAALFVLSFRYADEQVRRVLRGRAIGVLIPSLLPLASVASVSKVDYGAHVGGALAGAIIAWLLLGLWRDTDVLPGFRWASAVIVVLGLAGTLTGGAEAATKFREFQAAFFLIPPESLPKKDSDIHETSVRWYLGKFPNDPRSHFYSATFRAGKHDFPGAEQELRTALAQEFVLDNLLNPAFKDALRGYLALVLLGENRAGEARPLAAAACLNPSSAFSTQLRARGLCDKQP